MQQTVPQWLAHCALQVTTIFGPTVAGCAALGVGACGARALINEQLSDCNDTSDAAAALDVTIADAGTPSATLGAATVSPAATVLDAAEPYDHESSDGSTELATSAELELDAALPSLPPAIAADASQPIDTSLPVDADSGTSTAQAGIVRVDGLVNPGAPRVAVPIRAASAETFC